MSNIILRPLTDNERAVAVHTRDAVGEFWRTFRGPGMAMPGGWNFLCGDLLSVIDSMLVRNEVQALKISSSPTGDG